MTTGNDKNQSPIIAHRLPEFVQTDHPTMVAFVQAYYEWLDQQADQGYVRTPAALDGLSDVDKTIEEFVAAFKKEYLLGFPEEFAVNKEGDTVDVRQLIKNIKEFYRNKGTEKTYELLFRILYDTTVEFYYPSRDILRLSDGKWIQKFSIRCSNELGTKISESRGKTIVQRSSDNTIVASGTVVDVTVYQVGNRQVSELFLNNINGNFAANTDVLSNVSGIEFTDNEGIVHTEKWIYSVLSAVSISSKGSNYRKGDRIFFQPDIMPYRQNLLKWSNAIGKKASQGGNWVNDDDAAFAYLGKSGGCFPTLNSVTAPDLSNTGTLVFVDAGPNSYSALSSEAYGVNQVCPIAFDGSDKILTFSVYVKAADLRGIPLAQTAVSVPPLYLTQSQIDHNRRIALCVDTRQPGSLFFTRSKIRVDAKVGTTPARYIERSYSKNTTSPSTHSIPTYTITDVGNGWARITMTVTISNADANTQCTFTIYPIGKENAISYAWIYLWGAQLNEGSSATPFINTQKTILTVAATNDTGQGAIATITDVDSNGGILKTRMDNFGIGYEIAPTYTFDSAFGSGAALTTTIGTICRYPGYYSSNDGRLSTNKVMQDNHYYQNFSYVLLTETVIDRYKDILRRIIHPAGMGMFGKVSIKRCATEDVTTDTIAKKTDLNAIGNYAPYTLYTYRDLGSLFFNGRALPYVPSIDDATITGAGGNPTGLTGLTSAHYQVAFTPKGITGLKIWLDGKTITANASNTKGVTAWGDSSGNGYTATANIWGTQPGYPYTQDKPYYNKIPAASVMGGLQLSGSSMTASSITSGSTSGCVLTTPNLRETLQQRSLFVAFTPNPLPSTDITTSQQNTLVVGLMRGLTATSNESAESLYTPMGQNHQLHSICVDYSRNIVDGNEISPRIAAYYGVGNHKYGLSAAAGNGEYEYKKLVSYNPDAFLSNRLALMNNKSSIIYYNFKEPLVSLTANNPNTTIVSSIFAESDPSLTAAAYSYATEVKKFDKKSNNDQPDARYYRYQKMAEFVATENGSYNFSMDMKTDYGNAGATAMYWRAILTKNDQIIESSTQSQPDVPNQIAEWGWSSMSRGLGTLNVPYYAPEYDSKIYQTHKVSAKDVKAGDVLRVWMTPSRNAGTKPLNSTLLTAKALYTRNFTVNKIYSQGKNFLTVNGVEVGTALGNWNGSTGEQRLTIGLGQNYFNGVVHEVLLYDRALTKQERETIEAYLYKRWTGNIIPVRNHSWYLPIDTASSGIYPALPTEDGYTANTAINSAYGYPYFTINENPNLSLATEVEPYAARILDTQYSDFLGGGTGSAGYWSEWAEGSTANRQNWAASLTAAGSRNALLKYSTSSEFRKITAEAFLDRKVGLQFDCKNEEIVEPYIPQVKLTYCLDFVNSTVYSNGTIIFNYTILNSENMNYWITDRMEVEVSDGRKLYRYRPEAAKWKQTVSPHGEFGQFKISGFTSEGIAAKQYTVTFRLLNYYGKVISGSELSVSFSHQYAGLSAETNSLTTCTEISTYTDPNAGQTTPSYRFGTTLATGVPSGEDIGDDPDIWKWYWDDRIKVRSDDWFWQLGKDDTMPLFEGGNYCDPLGLKTFWKPGSAPFSMPKDDPLNPNRPGWPILGGGQRGQNYRLPTEIPPLGVEPKYVNDNDGSEVYYWSGHWWIRTRTRDPLTGNLIITWRFKIPMSNPDDWTFGKSVGKDGELEEDTFDDATNGNNAIEYGNLWTKFVPCYGVPLCFEQTSDGGYRVKPDTFGEDIPQFPLWGKPSVYPPGWFPGQINPYNVPNDDPSAPFPGGWRKTNVPAGKDKDRDPYYGRGWDPFFGPFYLDPNRGLRPYGYGGVDVVDAPDDFFSDRKLEHPPCKNGGNSPGIEPPKPPTAQGLDDRVPGL